MRNKKLCIFKNALKYVCYPHRKPVLNSVIDHIADIFNFCKDQEFLVEDDPEKRTLSHTMCKEIMEDFLVRVNIPISTGLCVM